MACNINRKKEEVEKLRGETFKFLYLHEKNVREEEIAEPPAIPRLHLTTVVITINMNAMSRSKKEWINN